jgi:phosphorylcholine metabolism protein LicD
MNKDDVFREVVDNLDDLLGPRSWWCDAGTCLAIVRNGDFIAETDDVDIGIYSEFVNCWDLLIQTFKKIGFTLSKIRTHDKLMMTIGFTGPEKLDLFFYHEKRGYRWHTICGWQDERKKRKVFKPEKFTEDLFMTLKEVQFKDRTVFLPNPPEVYLFERYGPDWRTPNPDYKFWRDSQAIDMEFA